MCHFGGGNVVFVVRKGHLTYFSDTFDAETNRKTAFYRQAVK